MRRTVIGTGLVLALLAGGWLGAESMASRQVAALFDADPALQAAAVRPLRDPRALGITVTEPQFRDPAISISLPWARLSLSPLSPLTTRLDLPEQGQLSAGGRIMDLGLTDPQASLSLAPLSNMAPDRLDLSLGAMTLDGAPLAGGLTVQGRLVDLAPDAPATARAAYDLTLSLRDLSTDGLVRLGLDPGPMPGPVSASGPLRIWLDDAPSVTGGAAPRLTGWQTEGLSLQAGDIGLRLVGRLSRDDQGRAEGQLALYSTDADAMIAMAAGLGLIPAQAQMLLRAGLSQLSRAPMDQGLPGPVFPDPAEGELRLPITMRDGQLSLGGVSIGAAPLL